MRIHVCGATRSMETRQVHTDLEKQEAFLSRPTRPSISCTSCLEAEPSFVLHSLPCLLHQSPSARLYHLHTYHVPHSFTGRLVARSCPQAAIYVRGAYGYDRLCCCHRGNQRHAHFPQCVSLPPVVCAQLVGQRWPAILRLSRHCRRHYRTHLLLATGSADFCNPQSAGIYLAEQPKCTGSY